MNIIVDETKVLELLMDRVRYWTSSEDVIELYRVYYSDLINLLDDYPINIEDLVDNDYVNNLIVLSHEDAKQYPQDSIVATTDTLSLVDDRY